MRLTATIDVGESYQGPEVRFAFYDGKEWHKLDQYWNRDMMESDFDYMWNRCREAMKAALVARRSEKTVQGES